MKLLKLTKNYKNVLKYFTYFAIILTAIFVIVSLSFNESFKRFIESSENNTFDIRQNIISQDKKVNDDIVILAIDEVSYEYILNEYGSWPISRGHWSNIIEKLNTSGANLIIFDMLFVSKFGENNPDDMKFISTVNKNDNVVLSIDFDNHPEEIRQGATYHNGIKTTLANNDLIKKSDLLHFGNSRGIIREIQDVNSNLGVVNVVRDNDGTVRKIPPYVVYKNDFYNHLALLGAIKYLGIKDKNFEIKNNEIILDKNHKIPLEASGRTILNWYGPQKSFKHIPLYELDKAIKENNTKFIEENFKNKIIYIGATVVAMSDIKTTPLSIHYPGVEIHTTFLNNILDNNLIKKTSVVFDLVVSLILSALVLTIIFKNNSLLFSNIECAGVFILHLIISTLAMEHFNLWIGIIIPITFGIVTYVLCYIVKYLLKSRDYEETYKLAVTDALTELYNHRFFQEKMIENFDLSARYGSNFSIIMIDIDFFKKFNDTYGHQSGDAVLKQVAKTIKKNVRSTDIPCRYGGEEMAVILTNTNKNEASITAEKICQAVREREFVLVNGEIVHVTISVGVASSEADGKAPQELIEYSDKCLYIAKENGRNQVVTKINP